MNSLTDFFFKDTYSSLRKLCDDVMLAAFNPSCHHLMTVQELSRLPFEHLSSYHRSIKSKMDDEYEKGTFRILAHHKQDVFRMICREENSWHIRKILEVDKKEDRLSIIVMLESTEVFRLHYRYRNGTFSPLILEGISGFYRRKLEYLHQAALNHHHVRIRILL